MDSFTIGSMLQVFLTYQNFAQITVIKKLIFMIWLRFFCLSSFSENLCDFHVIFSLCVGNLIIQMLWEVFLSKNETNSSRDLSTDYNHRSVKVSRCTPPIIRKLWSLIRPLPRDTCHFVIKPTSQAVCLQVSTKCINFTQSLDIFLCSTIEILYFHSQSWLSYLTMNFRTFWQYGCHRCQLGTHSWNASDSRNERLWWKNEVWKARISI